MADFLRIPLWSPGVVRHSCVSYTQCVHQLQLLQVRCRLSPATRVSQTVQ